MASYPMSREGCTTECIGGKLILKSPTAPAIDRDLGLCNATPSFGTTATSAADKAAAQARYQDQLARIAQMQTKMDQDMAAAELRMNPPKPKPGKTNPAFVAAGMAGIAAAKAKTEQMRRNAFSHVD